MNGIQAEFRTAQLLMIGTWQHRPINSRFPDYTGKIDDQAVELECTYPSGNYAYGLSYYNQDKAKFDRLGAEPDHKIIYLVNYTEIDPDVLFSTLKDGITLLQTPKALTNYLLSLLPIPTIHEGINVLVELNPVGLADYVFSLPWERIFVDWVKPMFD